MPSTKTLQENSAVLTKSPKTKAIVICPCLNRGQIKAKATTATATATARTSAARLEEVICLAGAISLDVVFSETVNLGRINPATFIGLGHVETIKGIINGMDARLLIMDCRLSPMQQRNLEKIWQIKVIDRTALILEIFGERASTKEGVLQVELAHLTYQKSRLVKSWTHLERQRGGAGFLCGPGEKQIEMDRRIIGEKIIKLNKELESVKRTRSLHRKARGRVPFPVVALVGYTNAGKSTLFNKLTGADVLAKDQLFATLDPTMRQITLPKGTKAILSDTVGFVSDLPTELVAAFRATLEEVLEADLILHIRDISHPDSAAQKNDVLNVLKGIGANDEMAISMLEVQNKIDLLPASERQTLQGQITRKPDTVAVSAISGQGIAQLLAMIEAELGKDKTTISLTVSATDGALAAWLYRHSEILHKQENKDKITFTVKITSADLARLQALSDDNENPKPKLQSS